jgi:Holliday junction resolvase-like predicted endonuclease
MPRAGQNIRQLALKRRLDALGLGSVGLLLLLWPAIWTLWGQAWWARTRQFSPQLNLWGGLALFALGALLLCQAHYTWQRSNHAAQGARGEEAVAKRLQPLLKAGWQIAFGLADRQVGDIDVFLQSPQGNAYVIDVKSHGGTVFCQAGRLQRRYGKTVYAFEKDFLAQVRQQAQVMGRRTECPVVPILVFTKAQVDVPASPIADPALVVEPVHVWHQSELLSRLRQLG